MKKEISNLLGWKTSRKIVVIESDDWGSFRFKDIETRNKFLPEKDQSKCWMSYNDVFESAEDLKLLFEVLSSVKDRNRNSAKFTFLMNPANPNFKKIKEDNFTNYHYETFIETLDKRDDGKDILDLYYNSIASGMIEIGFHGREHLNVKAWMKDLQNKNEIAVVGFNHNMWGFSKSYVANLSKGYRSTFDIKSYKELESLENNIKEGVYLINQIFKQKTQYFLAPNGPYHLRLNKELIKNGIQFIGLPKIHNNPLEHKWWQKKIFWLGKKLSSELTVITRNVIFEPSSPRYTDWVEPALIDIEKAFKSKKPAIISSHRANYVSGLSINNRNEGLQQLNLLLKKIIYKFPEVEFMTSSQLGEIMKKQND